MVSKQTKNYRVYEEKVNVFSTDPVHNLLRCEYRSQESDQDELDMLHLLKIKFSRFYRSPEAPPILNSHPLL